MKTHLLHVLKTNIDVYIINDARDEQGEYFVPYVVAFSVSLLTTIIVIAWQVREIQEMKFVANNGYSKKWKKGDRIAGTSSGEDPRVKRDMEDRQKSNQQIKKDMFEVLKKREKFIDPAQLDVHND